MSHLAPEPLLIDYATGAIDDALGLFVACHVSLEPAARSRVDELESLGGELLDELAPVTLKAGALESLLARLDEPGSPPARRPAPDPVLPRPLATRMGPLRSQSWQELAPGVAFCEVPAEGGGVAPRVYRFDAGVIVPEHGHEGIERILVLSGSYTDSGVRYARGDVQIAGPELQHSLHIDPQAPCYALSVSDGAPVPSSP